MKIAIFGHSGVVGAAIMEYYEKNTDHQVFGRSLDSETENFATDIMDCDFAFVCVPTPFVWETKEHDLSAVADVLKYLSNHDFTGLVVIKSTMLPGSTVALQERFQDLEIFFNPEFLSSATAKKDFAHPDRQIIGAPLRDKGEMYDECSQRILDVLPKSKNNLFVHSTEAELIKYVNNMFGSLMVTFGNFMFDICEKADASFKVVKKGSEMSKLASPAIKQYWNVKKSGFRGYGGACFPKDMQSIYKYCKENGIPCDLLRGMIGSNEALLASQGLTEQVVEKNHA